MPLHTYDDVEQGTEEWLALRRGIVRIPLTRGFFALIDEADEPLVKPVKNWHAVVSRDTVYAGHRIGSRVERMHNLLTGWTLVDHINGDTLDNRRCNLRPATVGQNAQNRRKPKNNTSGYKGVSFHRHRRKWQAAITANKVRIHIGYFDDPADAARAYDDAARKHHGEFARTNMEAA